MTKSTESDPAPVVESIVRDGSGQLVVRVAGRAEAWQDARIARCFPWSLPGGYVSIRDKDGKEIVLLKTLTGLDPAVRQMIEEELAIKIFNPKINRVLDHKSEFGITSVTADTDRGNVTFEIRSRDDIRLLSPFHALFRDADGNTYEIEDFRNLDGESQKALQQYF